MKIIQTFWTAEQDPLKHSFGWTHPEYNLMSWALSCLSLREHYDEVELYTDSAGYHILIEVLQLPYTKTHVIFDDFQCLPHHWALSKIKTYSLQTEPFLHIDGDIYLSRPLPERILNAPLVAQNREISTKYYEDMVTRIREHKGLIIPTFIINLLENGHIPSYNMGFFGGKDISTIKEYSEKVLEFYYKNGMNDTSDKNSAIRCNVFMEQIFLASFADYNGKNIECVLKDSIKDNGYSQKSFCDFSKYKQLRFLHILGGHKRKNNLMRLLKMKLSLYNPAIFCTIRELFAKELSGKPIQNINEEFFSIEKSIALYEDFIEKSKADWQKQKFKQRKIELQASEYLKFISDTSQNQSHYKFTNNPYLKVYEVPQKWNSKATHLIRSKISNKSMIKPKAIVIAPPIHENEHIEYALTDTEYECIRILQHKTLSYNTLMTEISKSFNLKLEEREVLEKLFISNEIHSLLYHGIILIDKT